MDVVVGNELVVSSLAFEVRDEAGTGRAMELTVLTVLTTDGGWVAIPPRCL